MVPHPTAGETVKAALFDTALNEKFHNGHRWTEIVHKQNKDGYQIFEIQLALLVFRLRASFVPLFSVEELVTKLLNRVHRM